MRGVLAFVFWCVGASSALALPDGVSSCAHVEEDASRTLCHEAVLDARSLEVWRLISTSEGLSSWAAPVASIELRIGGVWEASYAPGARFGDPGNIRNRVLSYAPGRMLSIAVDRAPPGFPEPDLVRNLWTVIELEPVGESQTRVRVSMLGYGAGAGYEALYAMFASGNALTLARLRERVSSGRAVEWSARQTATLASRP